MVFYLSSRDEKIVLNDKKTFLARLKDANFHEYDWGWDSSEKKHGIMISNFRMQEKEIEIELAFIGTKKEKVEALNNFFKVTESDLLMKTPGKLYVDDYYLECYIVSGSSGPSDDYNGVSRKAKILAPNPFWMEEALFHYDIQDSTTQEYLDYEHDYPHDYTSSVSVQEIVNDSLNGLDFEFTIYGPCVDPAVYIGGHIYSVEGTVEENERLIINSRSKKIYKVMEDGTEENFYMNRNRDYYIFQKIKSGETNVSWSGSFSFDLKTYEERSEPKWT